MATSTEVAIATQTLGSAASSITFNSIPASWTDLRIVFTTPAAAANYYLYIELNGDTSATYSRTILDGDGSTANSSRSTADNFSLIGYMSSTVPTFRTVDIFSYAGSTYKTLLTNSNQDKNGSGEIYNIVGLWRNTSAITSIALKPQTSTLPTGTTATIYGIL